MGQLGCPTIIASSTITKPNITSGPMARVLAMGRGSVLVGLLITGVLVGSIRGVLVGRVPIGVLARSIVGSTTRMESLAGPYSTGEPKPLSLPFGEPGAVLGNPLNEPPARGVFAVSSNSIAY